MTDYQRDLKDALELDEGDVVPAADPDFDRWIATVAPQLNAPDTTPRLEMWQAIQAARLANGSDGGGSGAHPLRRRPPWFLMSAIAAALLLGVALDRVALRGRERPAPVPALTFEPVADSANPTRVYRLAAAQTLTQAEALLTAFRASAGSERDAAEARQLGRWGREVLSSTRLLIDSPAGRDPLLRALFDDLELVLVQIIQLAGGELDPSERALIDRALEDRDLLPRLRTAVPAGTPAVAEAASDD